MSITRLAALTLAASFLLAGCGQAGPTRVAMPQSATSGLAVRAAADVDFASSAKKAIDAISKNKEYKNPRLVGVDGVGLDKDGKLVPLLGASWTFKFWVAGENGDYRVDVIQHVEGDLEISESNEGRETDQVRVIDPAKLVPPTQLVPMAIKLGLKVNRQSPTFNYFDISYNATYADPTSIDTDVADVTSYYRHDQLDGLHLPATVGFFPGSNPAPATPAAPVAPKPTKMTPAELAKAARQHMTAVKF
jgi:hypothetical protein